MLGIDFESRAGITEINDVEVVAVRVPGWNESVPIESEDMARLPVDLGREQQRSGHLQIPRSMT